MSAVSHHYILVIAVAIYNQIGVIIIIKMQITGSALYHARCFKLLSEGLGAGSFWKGA